MPDNAMSRTSPRSPALLIENIQKSFGEHRVLGGDGLSLDVREGEFFSLLGPSGCGKTTLLRIIAGLETADAGVISFEGTVWSDPARRFMHPPQRRNIGFVFQNYAIWPHMTVRAHLEYALHSRRVPRAEIAAEVERVLALVGLERLALRNATQLSGGQQQRVALARAIVARPSLLLLDEPFSNLDVTLRSEMRRELRELQRRLGLSVVLVTHDQEEAFALSDRIAVMREGEVEQIAPPREVYDQPANDFVRGFVGRVSAICASISGEGWLTVPSDASSRLFVRPEDIVVEQAGAPADALVATVFAVIYLGWRTEVELALPGGDRLIAYVGPDWDGVDGSRAAVRLHRRSVNRPEAAL